MEKKNTRNLSATNWEGPELLFRIGKPNCHATILFNESAEEEAAQNMNAKYTETHAIQNWETPYHGMDIVMRLSFFEGIVLYTYNHIYI